MELRLPSLTDVDTVVLVEGDSDAAAVRVTAALLGRDLDAERVGVVAMGGATNIRHYLLAVCAAQVVAHGMCDANEARGFRRALAHVGLGSDLEAPGFVVCHADLEDEYLRSIGTAGVLDVVAGAGDAAAFEAFSRQPAQRDRALHARLRRFLGTRSGRKVRYGSLLAAAAAPDHVPEPLRRLLGR